MCPNVRYAVVQLSLDNGIGGYLTKDWDKLVKTLPQVDWECLEIQAAKISSEDMEELVAGGTEEREAVVAKYACELLDEFINEVFDGKYTPHVYPGLCGRS